MRWYSVSPRRKRWLDRWARLGPWRYLVYATGFLLVIAGPGYVASIMWVLKARGVSFGPHEALLLRFTVDTALLFCVYLALVAALLARDYPRVLVIGLNHETALVEIAGGGRIPITAVREIRTGRAGEFHGRWAGSGDETQMVLEQPPGGAARLPLHAGIPGYAAAVLRLRGLLAETPSPSAVLGRRFSFAYHWLRRWVALGLFAWPGTFAVWDLVRPGSHSDPLFAAGFLVVICGTVVLSWLVWPWSLGLEPEGLYVRYALRTQRIPWGHIAALEEPGPASYMVQSSDGRVRLDAAQLSPLPDLVAAIAHFSGLPIPDPAERQPGDASSRSAISHAAR